MAIGTQKKLAQEFLEKNEKVAREYNSKGFRWLKDCFGTIFEECKSFNNATKEKIVILEGSMKIKFIRIDEEIDYKVSKWKSEIESHDKWKNNLRILFPIFDDYTTDRYHNKLGEQNRIDLIWHDMKQSIEVKLDEISNETGKTHDKIPWHSFFLCDICSIYLDRKTNVKYMPPRFAHEQNPEMKIGHYLEKYI